MIFSKKLLTVISVLLLSISFSLAQNETDEKKVVSEDTVLTTPESTNQTNEDQIYLNTDSTSIQPKKKTSTAWVFIRMILVLALIIVCIYFVMNFMKKNISPTIGNDPFLRRVSSISVGTGKSVQIVTLLEHAYMIGVSDDSVNLISEISDKELIEAMNLYADKNTKENKPKNFSDVLAIFMPQKKTNKSTGIYSETESTVTDFLKKQRNKINGKENE